MQFLLSAISVALFTTLCITSPIPEAIPAAVQATKFATTDFPVNVIFGSGPAQFGMWIPRDGIWRSTFALTCLNMPAYTYGACSIPTVDFIGVVAGSGPCSFVGSNGFWNTVPGIAGEGWYTVGPPQNIVSVVCGP